MASMDSTSSCRHTSSICSAIKIASISDWENENASHCVPFIACIFHFDSSPRRSESARNILAFKIASQFSP
jgi:hypothetical protein